MEKIKLLKEDITPGEPLPWNIYQADGKILLKKGTLIGSKEKIDRLFQLELTRDADNSDFHAPAESRNPFIKIKQFSDRLEHIYSNIKTNKVTIEKDITQLASDIKQLSAESPDIFLGAVHIFYPSSYSLMQPVYSALLGELTAQVLKLPDESRLSLCCAALTANIGMYSYQDKLNQQPDPLNDSQKEKLNLHPYQGVKILKSAGIKDDLWLSIIAQHHERSDGSGYPAGITSNTIKIESKIINICDSYLAMITERAYSTAIQPKEALKDIFHMATEADQTIYLAFIKTLGIFPPGTFIKLANGEIAMVTYRYAGDSLKCKVASISKSDLIQFETPIERDTANPEYAIKSFFAPPKKLTINPLKLWNIN